MPAGTVSLAETDFILNACEAGPPRGIDTVLDQGSFASQS
jgi:hypothetical protein